MAGCPASEHVDGKGTQDAEQLADYTAPATLCVPTRAVHSELTTAAKHKSPFPANVVRNQKYSVLSFLPLVFYEQFKFFFNFYFLAVTLSQFIPALKIGEPSTSNLLPPANGRLYRDVRCTPGVCPGHHDGQRGLRRLPAIPP